MTLFDPDTRHQLIELHIELHAAAMENARTAHETMHLYDEPGDVPESLHRVFAHNLVISQLSGLVLMGLDAGLAPEEIRETFVEVTRLVEKGSTFTVPDDISSLPPLDTEQKE